MEAFSYTLDACWELTLPEIAVHMTRLGSTVAEPDWFVHAWRAAADPRQRLEALRQLME